MSKRSPLRSITLRIAALVTLGLLSVSAYAATWYVRPDGGTRFTQKRVAAHLSAQCDGLADAPYPGSGTNRHCAFNDVRFLWGDATWGNNGTWVIAGGDTAIVRGSLKEGVTYRIGWPNAAGALDPATKEQWGIPGDPYGSGPPPPPSGTAEAHTRILGGNYGNCHEASARTQLHGGFGVQIVFRMDGVSYVDLECLDITDFSECGRSAQVHGCNTNPGTLDDYATNGITWSSTSTHDTVTDVNVHGIAGSGMSGPTGDGVVFDYLGIIGNASSGWNADAINGKTGTGSLLVRHFNISWNGCAEQYPIRNALPYTDCTDDNVGGYGDGFGTATVPSKPGWTVVFDQGIASYNTQDGLDALHVNGAGSSTTVTHTLAFGNMGQQIKIGGSKAVVQNNVIYGNCHALQEDIPGTVTGYNKRLSDYCRAADTAIVISVNDDSTGVYEGNVLYTAGSTGLQVAVNESCATPTCRIHHSHNIFIGFPKSKANGYAGADTDELPNPVYVEDAIRAYTNPGSTFDHNVTFHARPAWHCPNVKMHETDGRCGDPHLTDETWHRFGHGDTTVLTIHGKAMEPDRADGSGNWTRASMVALPASAAIATLWAGLHYWNKRAGVPSEATVASSQGD